MHFVSAPGRGCLRLSRAALTPGAALAAYSGLCIRSAVAPPSPLTPPRPPALRPSSCPTPPSPLPIPTPSPRYLLAYRPHSLPSTFCDTLAWYSTNTTPSMPMHHGPVKQESASAHTVSSVIVTVTVTIGGRCMYVCMYVCMYDYIAMSTRTLTPPTTGTD